MKIPIDHAAAIAKMAGESRCLTSILHTVLKEMTRRIA
jgi:hypothetical protein